MTEEKDPPSMPAGQRAAFVKSYREYRRAIDPQDPWSLARLATVVRAALDAGWSLRSIAKHLKLTRERTRKLAETTPHGQFDMAPYRRGDDFPRRAINVFDHAGEQIRSRRNAAERTLAANIRTAHARGWSYPQLAAIAGVSRESVRLIAESAVDTDGIPAIDFEHRTIPRKETPPPAPRPRLEEDEKARFRHLTGLARQARKTAGGAAPEAMELRRASEELSGLIISAKNRGISWDDLDDACGYRRGGARARATRHGYGKLPPSMKAYHRSG